MKNFKYVPYDKRLVSRARELRKDATPAEKSFRSKVLKDKKLTHLKFTRQKPIGNFIADFYCARLMLAIEIDGDIHLTQKTRDKERDNILKQKFGIKVVRYKNEEVLNDISRIIKNLIGRIEELTHPSLSLIKEGQKSP